MHLKGQDTCTDLNTKREDQVTGKQRQLRVDEDKCCRVIRIRS
jgi:hypothetical protein